MNGTPTAFGIMADMGVSHLSGVTCSPGGLPQSSVFRMVRSKGSLCRQTRPSVPKRCIYVWVCLTLWK